jgi:hypothetical protein
MQNKWQLMGGGIYDVAGGDASSTVDISYMPQFSDVASRCLSAEAPHSRGEGGSESTERRRRAAAHSAKERAASDFAERFSVCDVARVYNSRQDTPAQYGRRFAEERSKP